MSTDYNTTSMNYGGSSPMQRMPSGKPQVHDAGGGKGEFYYFVDNKIETATSSG